MEATSTLAVELALAVLNEPHQRLPYAKQLLPVSPTEDTDDGSSSGFSGSVPSTWTTLPDSERANPLLWPSWMTPTKDMDNSWTTPSPATERNTADLTDTDVKSNIIQPSTNSNLFFSEFSGSQKHYKASTVVTVDVEQIGPDDTPDHPLDMEFGSPATAPRKMFTRKPYGIAVNSKTEQIYVADREYNVVLILGPDGSFQSQFGGLGSQPGKFYRPTALAFDAETDRLYVTDKDNHRVQVFSTTTGQFLFRFGSKGSNAGQLSYPWGIAILNKEGSSLVAVADSRNARVQFFTKEGLYLDHFDAFSKKEENKKPSQKPTKRRQPRGLAFDPTGDLLYISDFNVNCIFKLDLAGRTIEKFFVKPAAGFSSLSKCFFYRPSGLDVDSEGTLFVCDHRNQSLRKFQKDGTEVDGFLNGVSFELPTDVSLYPGLPGYLAVIDLNGRVRVLNYSN